MTVSSVSVAIMADPSAVYTLLPRVAECWGGGFPFIPVITFILPHTFCVRVCVCLSLSSLHPNFYVLRYRERETSFRINPFLFFFSLSLTEAAHSLKVNR